MPVSVTLPALGESVTEGTITRWLKQPGDSVEVDEPLLEVSTDKVDTEIPSPAAGTLLEQKVGEDETVEVGAELATIGEPSEAGGGGEQQGGGQAESPPAEQAPQETAEQAPQEPAEQEAGESAGLQEQAGQQQEQAGQQEQAPPEQPQQQPSGGGGGETTPVTLPALGESVTEGTITRWLKQPGDSVEVDEALLEVSTDKVDTEIPSPVAGVLVEIKVGEDETVEVGAELATIGPEGAAPAEQPQRAAPQQSQPQEAPPQQPQQAEEPEASPEPEQAATAQEDRETAPGQGDQPAAERADS
ncbi:MAG: 2-oxoglutarate dehydrogenase, E2 component, dihydrolipoamide succinyltransferase, partial [Actinomycetota bacterium]|nr:2-oxoglutarate dehydrogenase, E2 component, dihydrolipoamide succinyltransferase [Actinomycetota bacterium]